MNDKQKNAVIVGKNGEILFTLTGVSVLSFGHYKNQQFCKFCCS